MYPKYIVKYTQNILKKMYPKYIEKMYAKYIVKYVENIL